MPLLSEEELIKEMKLRKPPFKIRALVSVIPNRWDIFTLLLAYILTYISYGFNPLIMSFVGIGATFILMGIRIGIVARLQATWVNNIELLRDLYMPRPFFGGFILAVIIYALVILTPWYLYI